jgi:hypothetical protein
MGTSANLLVVQGDRRLGLHVSNDGYPSNVLASLAAPIALLGVDRLRTQFAAASLFQPGDDGCPSRSAAFKANTEAYIETCEAAGVEPFDLDGLLHYRFGRPDFAHSGGGLLYGTTHVRDSDFFDESSNDDCDYLLDLDAGTLTQTWGACWQLDLNVLEGRNPDAVFAYLNSTHSFAKANGTGVTRATAAQQDYNIALNATLAGLPARDEPWPVASPSPAVDSSSPTTPFPWPGRFGEPTGTHAQPPAAPTPTPPPVSTSWMVRVHPDDFVLIRALNQILQQAATAQPELQALLPLLRVERNEAHVGVVLESLPEGLEARLRPVGEAMVQAFGAQFATLSSDGSYSLSHPGGSIVSTGHMGFGGEEDEEGWGPQVPQPSDLSSPFSMDKRQALRQQWIDTLLAGTAPDPAAVVQSLQSEAFLALALFDVDAYAQLTKPELIGVLGPASQWGQGAGELAAQMAHVETQFSPGSAAVRYQALPQEAKDQLLSDMDTVSRHAFGLALGLKAAPRRKGP